MNKRQIEEEKKSVDELTVDKPSIEGESKVDKKPLNLSFLMYILTTILLVGITLFVSNKVIGLNEQFTKSEFDKANKERELNEKISSLSERLEKSNQSIKSNQAFKKTTSDLKEHINSIETQLQKAQKEISEKKGDVSNKLLFAEVEYLIRAASTRLILTGNSKVSVRLLEEADLRIVKLNDISMIAIREALKSDLYKLRAAEQIDITGAYLRLEVLITEIGQLKANFILPANEQKQTVKKLKKETWKEHMVESSTKVFSKWFQVAHYNEKINPLRSQQQVSFFKQGLSLKIKQAQWALIQRELKLYQIILNDLHVEIKENFNQLESRTVQAEIKKLIAESMISPLPKELTVSRTINEYMLNQKKIGNQE